MTENNIACRDCKEKQSKHICTVSTDSLPGYRTSRRSLLAVMTGGAILSSLAISNLALPIEAQAKKFRKGRKGKLNRRWYRLFGNRNRKVRRNRNRKVRTRGISSSNRSRAAACFLRGTLIETRAGEVAIEKLQIGDLVRTASGGFKPIKWIGQMRFNKSVTAHWDRNAAPIRITKSAICDGVPHSDLYVSASHSLYINGMLIPASKLVNGLTITRCSSMPYEVLEYFHIELANHDAIFSNGMSAETLNTVRREDFDNYEEYVGLYGSAQVALPLFAPNPAYPGVIFQLNSHLRSAMSPIVDIRRPFDVIRDSLADRAEQKTAA